MLSGSLLMRQISFTLLFLFSLLSYGICNDKFVSALQHGDLLFNIQVEGSDFGDAIVKATKGNGALSISHVAIVIKDSLGTRVVEATGKHGVWICPIDTFLNNSAHSQLGEPLVLIGRLKDRRTVDASVIRAQKYVGRPYDWVFSNTDEALYCSELVQLSYLDTEGNTIFPQQPMSFHDASGTILPYWIDYYKKKGLEVPEGEPGTNPSDLSKSDKLEIVNWDDLVNINKE